MQSTLYKLVAFDLDGTFLNDQKQIPEENRKLLKAVEKTYIVPATGRLYSAIPEEIRNCPAARYFITINGAEIYDKEEDRSLFSSGISVEDAEKLVEYGKTIPAIYDCYQDSRGLIDRKMYLSIPEFLSLPQLQKLVMDNRTPVGDFWGTVKESGAPIQKFQYYFHDEATRDEYLPEVMRLFPQYAISKSSPLNIEINMGGTNKGRALQVLCEMLDIPQSASIAFGDDINDVEMLSYAGHGFAMKNGVEEVKKAADDVTEFDNNSGGVGRTVEKLLKEIK